MAIVSASGCSQEELREECVVIDLDAVQLMEHSHALGEAVLNRTGDTHWGIQGSFRRAGGLAGREAWGRAGPPPCEETAPPINAGAYSLA